MLVTVVAQFTVKTTNSEFAIYFLSFMSCSINRHKSHILFACKNFTKILCLRLNMEKKIVPGNGGEAGALPAPPFSTALLMNEVWKNHEKKDTWN